MKYRETCIRRETLYRGKILNLRKDEVRLPNGRQSVREVVEHCGGVGVLPLKDGKVWLVRQFRYPYGEELLEIPAGKRDPDESDRDCGMRELREETGFSARELVPMGTVYPSPGYTDEVIAVYCARAWEEGDQQPDPDEFLDVVQMSFREACELAVSGRLKDAKTVVALLRAARMFPEETGS